MADGSDEVTLTPGPFEAVDCPDWITATVTTVGARPRIHGYDVDDDLSHHYSFAEIALLTLTGQAPDKQRGRAFEICLAYLSPISVSEAPCNAATIARISASLPKGVLGVGAIGLAEEAGFTLKRHRTLLDWLATPNGDLPADCLCHSDDDRQRVDRFAAALATVPYESRVLDQGPSLTTAVVATLYDLGLTKSHQLETAWVLARLCALSAEAFSARRGAYREYPLTLPEFRYVGSKRDE